MPENKIKGIDILKLSIKNLFFDGYLSKKPARIAEHNKQ
jgi:hypothetical protein